MERIQPPGYMNVWQCKQAEEQHKPVTEWGRWSGGGACWPSRDDVCDIGICLQVLCGLKLLLLVLLELASDATLFSALATAAAAEAGDDEGQEPELKDGL